MATTLLSIVLTAILNQYLHIVDFPILIITAIGVLILLLLFAILFNQKRLFELRFDQVTRLLIEQFGFYSLENQYFQRLRHFPLEKMKLAKTLVKEVLPDLIGKIREKHPNSTTINIILDSGTTITPIFRYLIGHHLKFDKNNIRIYTNNLAGIDEIHKFSQPDSYKITLSEEDVNLLGGRPLNKYRATIGSETINSLKTTLKNQRENTNDESVTIGILTSNWFIV
ncbi:MAG: hypothetical protein GY940_15180, partial [bacterium]|nr:hypothetical protein [bacterium]